MSEITVKNGAMKWKYTFVFGWVALLALLIGFSGGGEQEAKITESIPLSAMRISVFIQDIFLFIGPAIAFIYMFFRSEKFSDLALGKGPHPLWILAAIFVMFFSIPLTQWLGDLNREISMPGSLKSVEHWMKDRETQTAQGLDRMLSDKTWSGIVSNFFLMAFMAAISEELFFRGTVQRLLVNSKVNPHLAIWITAIIFSAIHVQFYGFFPRMVLGAFLGYLFLYTGNLWVSIIAHFLNNALALTVALTAEKVNMNPLEQNAGDDLGFKFSWSMIALSALLVIGIFVFLKRMNPKDDLT